MIKINFKQPKYIFPLVVFVPLCALIYFMMQTFKGSGDTEQSVATDRINMELPEAQAEEAGDKMYEMSRRFGDRMPLPQSVLSARKRMRPRNWSMVIPKRN